MDELEVGPGRHRAAITATLDEAREWLDAQVHTKQFCHVHDGEMKTRAHAPRRHKTHASPVSAPPQH